jgi:hypothetical protein
MRSNTWGLTPVRRWNSSGLRSLICSYFTSYSLTPYL